MASRVTRAMTAFSWSDTAGTEGIEDGMKHRASKIRMNEGSKTVREFYTVSQIAELLQLTEMTIYRMIQRGELSCYVIGRNKRFRSGDLEDFLASRRMPAVGQTESNARNDRRETTKGDHSQQRN
jgi:excisionase family DNA binding protein